MVLVKNWQFSHLFILGKKIPWKDVSRYSRKKNAFQGFKNMNLSMYKNCNFSEGVSQCFWSKIGNISIFLFEGKYCIKMCLRIF